MYLTIILLLVFPAAVVLAAPPALPASFYGRVRVSGSNAPAGSSILVRAGELDLLTVAITQDPTYGSVYAANVPADNPDTELIDGGQEGDVLSFYLLSSGSPTKRSAQTAVWRSGANVPLDLTFGTSYLYLPMILNSPRS